VHSLAVMGKLENNITKGAKQGVGVSEFRWDLWMVHVSSMQMLFVHRPGPRKGRGRPRRPWKPRAPIWVCPIQFKRSWCTRAIRATRDLCLRTSLERWRTEVPSGLTFGPFIFFFVSLIRFSFVSSFLRESPLVSYIRDFKSECLSFLKKACRTGGLLVQKT
jgi:hypothetical protein